ncbi:NAD(P)H-binding protein [Paenibacillus tengchongensis]|uniref:NAD(P)H-binding protein n=1 Tax=Paenibacillus tengchongensis TaxID=2608684 RepID=UPI00124F3EF4|nr:NAD(P)H-binding protein [Paenibacillus tengchongensis]
MRRILVLGGTRFFGKRLVERLLRDENTLVTILTRGQAHDDLGDRVHRLTADRSDEAQLAAAVQGKEWDVVYDNICYSPDEAMAAVRIFAGSTRRYILTSSLSVYDTSPQALAEGVFDPLQLVVRPGLREQLSYQEGKRLAEAVLLQQTEFPAAAVRFPIVLGTDDYTRRLHFHIEHILNGRPLGIPNLQAQISLIRSDEAAEFLYWLGFSALTGPVNACSDGTLTLAGIISCIEEATGLPADIRAQTAEEDMSPFGIPDSWYMDTEKARKAGFAFLKLAEWFPQLVHELTASLRQR